MSIGNARQRADHNLGRAVASSCGAGQRWERLRQRNEQTRFQTSVHSWSAPTCTSIGRQASGVHGTSSSGSVGCRCSSRKTRTAMRCRAPSTSDTARTRTLTRACQPGAAQNAGGRSRGLRDLPMRVGWGAVSSGAGWMPTPNARSLWWTSRTRLIPGSSCRKRGCSALGGPHPLGRVGQVADVVEGVLYPSRPSSSRGRRCACCADDGGVDHEVTGQRSNKTLCRRSWSVVHACSRVLSVEILADDSLDA